MLLFHRNPHLSFTRKTGHDNLPSRDPYPGIPPGNQIPVAEPAELPPVYPVDPHPVPHGDPSCQCHASITHERIIREELARSPEQESNPLPGNLLGLGGLGAAHYQILFVIDGDGWCILCSLGLS